MTDSPNRVDDPVVAEESLPRKRVNPLVWLLVLLAVIAAVWFFYNRTASNAVADTSTTTPLIGGNAQQDAAQAERAQADAASARKAARARATARAEAVKPRVADREAEPVAQTKPPYPTQALRDRVEGDVLVRVDVNASGKPTNLTLLHRSGSRDLDRAALDAIRGWTFRPAMKDGREIASTVEVPVQFRLDAQ